MFSFVHIFRIHFFRIQLFTIINRLTNYFYFLFIRWAVNSFTYFMMIINLHLMFLDFLHSTSFWTFFIHLYITNFYNYIFLSVFFLSIFSITYFISIINYTYFFTYPFIGYILLFLYSFIGIHFIISTLILQ